MRLSTLWTSSSSFQSPDVLGHYVQHLLGADVGAAVAGALQGADGRRDGGIEVGVGGGDDAAGEGAVVAAAVLGVEHQAQIQQLGLARR